MDGKISALVLTFLCAAVGGGCATTAPSASLPTQLAAIKNFQCVSPGIYRGAQPDDDGMEALKDLGIKTIVSLRVPQRLIKWEGHKADELDMHVVSLPLSNYDSPSDEDVSEFLTVVTDPARQPVFIHCRQGQLRTGALVASFRVLEQGWTVEEAYAEAKRYGFDDLYPWYLPLKWFIKDLDRFPASARRTTAALPADLRD